MKIKFVVVAPYLVFSLPDENGGQKDFSLKQGDTVELSDEHRTVRVLVARKQIVPLKEETPEKSTKK